MLLEHPRISFDFLRKSNEFHSKFHSRGVNRRDTFWFVGHSSLSHHAILTKIGAKFSYKRPGAFYSLKT